MFAYLRFFFSSCSWCHANTTNFIFRIYFILCGFFPFKIISNAPSVKSNICELNWISRMSSCIMFGYEMHYKFQRMGQKSIDWMDKTEISFNCKSYVFVFFIVFILNQQFDFSSSLTICQRFDSSFSISIKYKEGNAQFAYWNLTRW